jgi:hypothetical protein
VTIVNNRKENAPDCDAQVFNANGNLMLATRAEFYQDLGHVVTIAIRRREKTLGRVDPLVILGWGLGATLKAQVTVLKRQDPVWVYAALPVAEGQEPRSYATKVGKMFVGKLDKLAVFKAARHMTGLAPFGLKIHSQPDGAAKNALAASLAYTVLADRVTVVVNLRESVLNGTISSVRAQLAKWNFLGFNKPTQGWVTATLDIALPEGDVRDFVYKSVATPVTQMIQTH